MSEAPVATETVETSAPVVETKPVEQTPMDLMNVLTRLVDVFSKFVHQQAKSLASPAPIKAIVYRQPQGRFQKEFGEWLTQQKATEIVSVTQSESDGNVTLTLFYR